MLNILLFNKQHKQEIILCKIFSNFFFSGLSHLYKPQFSGLWSVQPRAIPPAISPSPRFISGWSVSCFPDREQRAGNMTSTRFSTRPLIEAAFVTWLLPPFLFGGNQSIIQKGLSTRKASAVNNKGMCVAPRDVCSSLLAHLAAVAATLV